MQLRSLILVFVIFTLRSSPVNAQTSVTTSDWQSDGSLVASVVNGILTISDTLSNTVLEILPEVPTDLFTAVWSPDGAQLGASDAKGDIYIWNLSTDRTTVQFPTILKGFEDTVTSLAWSHTGRWLAGSQWEGEYTLQVWDMQTFQPVFKALTGNTYKVAWSPVSDTLAVTTIGGLYSVNFDQITALLPLTLPQFSQFSDIATEYISSNIPVYRSKDAFVSITWSPDGTKIATGNFEGVIRIFDAVSASELEAFANTDLVTTLDWSPDGAYLTGFVRGEGVIIWETATYKQMAVFPTEANISHLSFSPMGGRLVFGGPSTGSNRTQTYNPIQIIVPDASPERLQAIAEACGATLPTNSRADLAVQLEAVEIPPACRADLLAVAAALESD